MLWVLICTVHLTVCSCHVMCVFQSEWLCVCLWTKWLLVRVQLQWGVEFLDIQATIECGFTLKRICDMTRTYSHYSKFALNCSVQHLTDMEWKYTTPQTFVHIDCLLNCIVLKLLQPLHKSIHFHNTSWVSNIST